MSGNLTRTFDTDFRVAGESVDGGAPVSYSYDPDSLLVGAGALSVVRDAQNGRVTGTTAGNVTDAYTYSAFGEVASYEAGIGATGLLQFAYGRDALGRIASKVETDASGTHVFNYTYDDVARLTQVTEDGTVVEGYGYDLNGNRTSSTNSAGIFDATFDAQDRIETYGNLVFTYTPNGELQSKTDTSTGAVTDYTYDALGNLRGVTLPDGTQIGYLVDGFGRRVGKTVNGVLLKQWLWRGRLQPVAELDGSGNVTARFVYLRGNDPSLIVATGATYRLVKDERGSVRQVIDVATGVVMEDIGYDTWGRVLSDTNPGFQAFGFAGGLYESETGLVRFGARDYDAEIGRWTSKDPLGLDGGPNTYVYVENDPSNRTDPSGLYGNDWSIGHAVGQLAQKLFGGDYSEGFAPGWNDSSSSSVDSSSSSGDSSTNLFAPVCKGAPDPLDPSQGPFANGHGDVGPAAPIRGPSKYDLCLGEATTYWAICVTDQLQTPDQCFITARFGFLRCLANGTLPFQSLN